MTGQTSFSVQRSTASIPRSRAVRLPRTGPPTRKLHKRLHTYRTLESAQVDRNEKAPTCGVFAEPSDGLEPSTPSLPFDGSGNARQPRASDSACFRPVRGRAICR